MFDPHLSSRRAGACIMFLGLILLWPLICDASSATISEADLDKAEPVEIASHIMSIDYANGILVVAENPVMIVDGVIGSEQLTTLVIDADGDPISFEELNSGQRVLVQGLKLVDGRVVGVRVQQR